MKGIPFLKKDIGKISAIIDSIDMLSDNSYTWITSLADNKSWCTEKTRDLFRLTDQVISDFEHLLLEYVYPDDVQEYLEEIENRLNGIHLDWGLCIRMRINDEQYAMFSFHAGILYDEKDMPEYMVMVIRNENVFRQFDALTDLYSEARYVEDLKNMIAQENPFAILQIHVKGFSTFNLVYGRDFSMNCFRQSLCALSI